MKKEQIKVMISKVKNKIWLFLKKIYAKLPEKMKVHIRKLKPKEKIKGEYRGSDRAEEMPVLKVSPNRNWIRLFWVLLVISIILGIYNNFTSVDTVTVEKETVIEEKLKDTNALESYVKGFAGVYHAWENTDREISKREKTLEKYLPETLQLMDHGMITTDCPTVAEVESVDIWSVKDLTDTEYEVTYCVKQRISEGEQTTDQSNVYQVTVHRDEKGKMLVVKNPTAYALPGKSSYEPEEKETDGSIDLKTQTQIEDFLNTFFKLYPQASAKELVYYVKDGVLPAIGKNYVYDGLAGKAYYMEGDQTKAEVYVKYLDQDLKITQVMQYKLTLEKGDNWKDCGGRVMKEKIENFIMKFSYREIRRRKMQAFKWRLETLRLMEKEELEFEYVEQKVKCEHKKNVCEVLLMIVLLGIVMGIWREFFAFIRISYQYTVTSGYDGIKEMNICFLLSVILAAALTLAIIDTCM